MNKALIGLILVIVGFLIMLIPTDTGTICSTYMMIGGVILLVGVSILGMRFRKWGYE